MRRFLQTILLLAVVSLALSGKAQAAGGNYVFDGGTASQQRSVSAALNASSFNWSRVPNRITIHIKKNVASEAAPGQIWIDSNLLNAGKFAWGTIQHEYAHQVDFFLMNDLMRAEVATKLGGASWWQSGTFGHSKLTSERFASTLAWSYWSSNHNTMRPAMLGIESGAIAPTQFRALVSHTLGA
jgi:hypothetical protein